MTRQRSLPQFRVNEAVRIRTDLTETDFESERGIIRGCSQDHRGGYAYAVCDPGSGLCCVFTEAELVPDGGAASLPVLGPFDGASPPPS